jgi:hypothetical protein
VFGCLVGERWRLEFLPKTRTCPQSRSSQMAKAKARKQNPWGIPNFILVPRLGVPLKRAGKLSRLFLWWAHSQSGFSIFRGEWNTITNRWFVEGLLTLSALEMQLRNQRELFPLGCVFISEQSFAKWNGFFHRRAVACRRRSCRGCRIAWHMRTNR